MNNHSWSQVTVYVSRSGASWRVGEVAALSQRSFSLAKATFALSEGDGYLIARPLAGTPFRSESFAVVRGRTAIWNIENASQQSSLVIR